jgi:hypothetical protein
MYNFLKNELGVKIPMSGSNYPMGVADARIQSQLDYIDVHQYWDLNWDGNSFFNNSMINNPSTSTIVSLGLQAVEGKPFTISEYNHPWPNNYQVEAPFFLAGYGSYTDVDAVMLFAVSEADLWAEDRTLSEFNCGRNNVLMTMMPSFGYAYRNGLILSAKNTTTVNYSDDDMYNLFQQDLFMYPDNLDKNIALTHKIRSRVNSPTNFDASTLPVASTNPYTSDTEQLIWDKNGLLKINTDQFVAFVGFLSQYKNSVIGNIKIIDADKFAGVTCLALDHRQLMNSRKMLLTIGTRQQNSNMVWSGDKKVIDKGTSPTVIEPTKITLQFTIDADSIRVNTLGTRGEKTMSRKIYKPTNGNQFVVTFDQNTDHSLWYGIESEWTIDKTVTIIKPEKGNELKVKGSQLIDWVGEVAGKKKIEYSENNGKDWKTIVSDQDANIFSYNWTVPYVVSDSCLIKVTDQSDNSIDGISGLFSINDNLLYNGGFSNGMTNWNIYTNAEEVQTSANITDQILAITITNGGSASWHLQLIQPGFKIEKGKTYDISFDASANQSRNIVVGIGQDGGGYTSYFSQSVALTTGMKNFIFSFTMTNTTDNNARFAMDLGGNNIGVSLDNIFLREHKIAKTMAVASPKSSEAWKVNKSYDITWTSHDINKINIYYKLANQSAWTAVASNITATLGKYSWTVPLLQADSCQIKLEDSEESGVNVISPKFFIKIPLLELTSPKADNIFLVNRSYDITWTSSDVNKVNLYYKLGNAASWIKFGNNLTASSGKYSWTVPNISSDSCQIKIENAEIANISAVSQKFYIGIPSVEIISPTEGETLTPGENYEIEWRRQFVDNLNLYYKTWNTSAWIKVGSKIDASLLRFSWKTPDITYDSCQIKAEDSGDASIISVSPKFYIKDLLAVNEYSIPSEYVNLQNYPNPFNHETTIKYSITEDFTSWGRDPKGLFITIKIYNSFGKEVLTLVNEFKPAGNYEVPFNAGNLAGGIYLCKLTSGRYLQTRKLLLMK